MSIKITLYKNVRRSLLAEERKEELPSNIKLNVLENQKILASHSIDYSIFEPTKTGLKKSIIDTTQPVRTHFELAKFHQYAKQQQGIEFKSGRGNKNITRTNLFVQVADWSNSHCKSSVEILNKYGYQREDDFKSYCTLSTQ